MEGEDKMDYNKMADSIAEMVLRRLKQGGSDMEGVNRTNIDDFLTVRGFGGYGYGSGGGYGGGGYGGHGGILREDAHADGTGRGENIKCNRDTIRDGNRFLSNEHQDIVRNDQFAQVSRQNADLRALIDRNQLSFQEQTAANAAKAAECCCSLGKEILGVKAELIALNKDTVIEGLKSDLMDAKFAALNNSGHGSH